MTDAAFENNPGIGHNRPDTIAVLTGELPEANIDLMHRAAELVESCTRMPSKIDDDATSSAMVDQRTLLSSALKEIEARRKRAKQPYLDGGKAVQGFFTSIAEPLVEFVKQIDVLQTLYLRFKADMERKRREEDARVANEAAEKLAAQVNSEGDLNAAVAAEKQAETAQQAATTVARTHISSPRSRLCGSGRHEHNWRAHKWVNMQK